MDLRLILVSLALFTAAPASAAPTLPAAAAACAECHGSNGVAATPGTPHINGQLQTYLTDTMEAFKSASRPTEVAQHTSIALTEKDLAATAKFYAAQKKAQRPAQVTDPTRVSAATKVYQQRCEKCHVDSGRDSDHDAPLIAGQALDYLLQQTSAYISGKRKFPFMMDDAYRGLSQEDLLNVSHYFAAQR